MTEAFLSSHQELAVHSMDEINHIVVLKEGLLHLINKDKLKVYKVLASCPTAALETRYKVCKSISHLSVWIIEAIATYLDEKTSTNEFLRLLEEIAVFTNHFINTLDKRLDSDALFLKITSEFLMSFTHGKQTPLPIKLELQRYLITISSLNENLAREATNLQLLSMRKIFSQWFLEYEDFKLQDSRLLIVGIHGPREGLIEMQYFQRLLKKHGLSPELNDRAIFIEMLPEQIAKIQPCELVEKFLNVHELNMKTGEIMLKNMSKDVLHQHAKEAFNNMDEQLKSRCPMNRSIL